MSFAWVGRSPAGWQFMQRGPVMTFAASANRARDRSAGSLIDANASGPRNAFPPWVWADNWRDAINPAQIKTVDRRTAGRMVHPLQRGVRQRARFRAAKSSFRVWR